MKLKGWYEDRLQEGPRTVQWSPRYNLFCLYYSLYTCFLFLAEDSACHQNMAVTQSLVNRIWTHWEETD